MSHAFDFLVFIGRFQPFHRGHLAVVQAGLQQAAHLIVLCGSAVQPRSLRNPFTWQERADMIRGAVTPADSKRLLIAPVMDAPYNEVRWVASVQTTVQQQVSTIWKNERAPRIGLIGQSLDGTSYYTTHFPQWEAMAVEHVPGANGSDIRRALLGVQEMQEVQSQKGKSKLPDTALAQLPSTVGQWLTTFTASAACEDLREEQAFVTAYRQAWAAAPYEPNFVTVDAVVVQAGHVLLIERDRRPGQGLLALPGGFVDPGERILDACLRELQEETAIALSLPMLRASIRGSQVFDAPHRSARARTITHAFLIELEATGSLPTVTGSDDARSAQWVPLGVLDPERLFEDHYFVIQALTGL